jgi:hypothetical protein
MPRRAPRSFFLSAPSLASGLARYPARCPWALARWLRDVRARSLQEHRGTRADPAASCPAALRDAPSARAPARATARRRHRAQPSFPRRQHDDGRRQEEASWAPPWPRRAAGASAARARLQSRASRATHLPGVRHDDDHRKPLELSGAQRHPARVFVEERLDETVACPNYDTIVSASPPQIVERGKLADAPLNACA